MGDGERASRLTERFRAAVGFSPWWLVPVLLGVLLALLLALLPVREAVPPFVY